MTLTTRSRGLSGSMRPAGGACTARCLVEQKPMSLAKDFRPQAVEDDSLPPAKETPEEVERRSGGT